MRFYRSLSPSSICTVFCGAALTLRSPIVKTMFYSMVLVQVVLLVLIVFFIALKNLCILLTDTVF